MTNDATTTAEGPLVPIPPARRAPNARWRFVLVCALIAAGVGFVLYKGLLSSLNYFDTVDQALAHRSQIGTTSIRLEGVVVPRTVDATATGATFSISGTNCAIVRVRNTGAPPSLFQPDLPVVVVGHFVTATSDLFESSQIIVDHTNKYAAANPERVKTPSTTC
jgi:cytochrome c-type biogenesis protein CcmE